MVVFTSPTPTSSGIGTPWPNPRCLVPVEDLYQALAGAGNLQTLGIHLEGRRLGDSGLRQLSSTFRRDHRPHLQHVEFFLGGNEAKFVASIHELIHALMRSAPNIHSIRLNLRGNRFGYPLGSSVLLCNQITRKKK